MACPLYCFKTGAVCDIEVNIGVWLFRKGIKSATYNPEMVRYIMAWMTSNDLMISLPTTAYSKMT